MTNESISNAIIGNTLRIIASGEYHPGAELTQKMASYIIELEQKLTDLAVQLANAESKCRELAAENSAIKVMNDCLSEEMRGYESDGAFEGPKMHLLWWKTETPATDAFLAEVRAQAHKEGAHFVANRMLAAWESGFIEDTAKNAADIARMILTSTEFMADAPEGNFDRSFADGVLEDIAAQLRKGAAL